jgi:hypothetical protein
MQIRENWFRLRNERHARALNQNLTAKYGIFFSQNLPLYLGEDERSQIEVLNFFEKYTLLDLTPWNMIVIKTVD